mmetsp:Transcript_32941/g.76960  ORF Transcript_32941/g.76960 Transcript_32941/m.76960 type:complete len:213 (+) Transcript_32941:163-801(+)
MVPGELVHALDFPVGRCHVPPPAVQARAEVAADKLMLREAPPRVERVRFGRLLEAGEQGLQVLRLLGGVHDERWKDAAEDRNLVLLRADFVLHELRHLQRVAQHDNPIVTATLLEVLAAQLQARVAFRSEHCVCGADVTSLCHAFPCAGIVARLSKKRGSEAERISLFLELLALEHDVRNPDGQKSRFPRVARGLGRLRELQEDHHACAVVW